jgi:AcrR family transcriptional regulator
MPRPRFSKLSAEKREQIIEAAAKEFVTYGYEGSSLNRILEEAGVSKGAAYYYFDDKADVFVTIVDHYVARMLNEINIDFDKLSAGTFWSSLMDLYRRLFARVPEEPWIMMAWKASSRLSQEARSNPLLEEAFNRGFGWFLAFLKRGQELGVVRTDLPDDLIFALFRGVDTAGDQWLLNHWDALGPEKAQALMLLIFDGIQRLLTP